MNKFRAIFSFFIEKIFGHGVVQMILAAKTQKFFERNYGIFDTTSCTAEGVYGLSQESGKVNGAIVRAIAGIGNFSGYVLLAGESPAVKSVYSILLRISEEKIATAGIMPDMDLYWNFEEPAPQVNANFSVIISQSMLEHLVDPFKHVKDCVELLESGGAPGYSYHDAGFWLPPTPSGLLPFLPGLVRRGREAIQSTCEVSSCSK